MSTRYRNATVLLAGVALGRTCGSRTSRPSQYYISEIDVGEADAYAKEYAPKARAVIKTAGGRFVAVGGVGGNLAGKLAAFEGEAPKRLTVQVWNRLEKIKAWRDSKDFAEIRKVGEKYATFSRAVAVQGVLQ